MTLFELMLTAAVETYGEEAVVDVLSVSQLVVREWCTHEPPDEEVRTRAIGNLVTLGIGPVDDDPR